MAVIVSMLRGINLAGHHRVAMNDLRTLYEALGFKNPRTYIQSGNVVFDAKDKDIAKLSKALNGAIEKKFGFRADAVLRTREEIQALLTANPLAARGIEPARNVVVFLSDALESGAAMAMCQVCVAPEEIHTDGRHLFCYYPDGQGRSKLGALVDRQLGKLKVMGTARNWNTVVKLLEMARAMEDYQDAIQLPSRGKRRK
jgi:uncharacterized protein (DUF1697 family)